MNSNQHFRLRATPEDQEAIIRGEKLLNQGQLELADCQALLELFLLVLQGAQLASDALSIIANRRGLERLDVRDACLNVAFGYEELEAALRFVTRRGLVDWTPGSPSGPIVSPPKPEERRIRR